MKKNRNNFLIVFIKIKVKMKSKKLFFRIYIYVFLCSGNSKANDVILTFIYTQFT